ncbi:unnamed protein product [Adineta ricciae]|uniref:Uncharacterized protein n=1 Tax=Adineta ricciae TaxID=249248 RepID=A0A815F4K6_ADIRI|nr:unnamed protein product [Adineta ricciae]CAF1677036.1 unnamed protein product [Adineta ricciae]
MDTLTDEQRKKFDESYGQRRHELPVCPRCGNKNDVVPAVRGRPTRELALYADEGHVKLSGCTEGYQGWCKKCQHFI